MAPEPPPAGARLQCETCGTEAIVLKAEGAEVGCCDRPMTVIFTPAAPG